MIIVIGNAVPTTQMLQRSISKRRDKMFSKTMNILDRTVMTFALILAAAPFLAIGAGAL